MMQLVSRTDWGARAPAGRTALRRSEQHGTAVHYSAADADEQADHGNCAGRVRGIQRYHMDHNGWADIAYSYLACKHGYVFAGRGLGVRTAAQGTNAGNDSYHAVCFLGDDTAGRDDVTDAGRQAIHDAVQHCNGWTGVSGVRPHSWFHSTGCPGDQLRAWIAAGMPTTGTATGGLSMADAQDILDANSAQTTMIVKGDATHPNNLTEIREHVLATEERVAALAADVAAIKAAVAPEPPA